MRDAEVVRDLYALLDEQRARCRAELADVLRSSEGLSAQDLHGREATATRLSGRLAQLEAAEHRLIFGRLDSRQSPPLYVGRLGLRSPTRARTLVDWRAPAAAPFYQATPAQPGSLVRRRHLHVRDRDLVGIHDEILDPDAWDATGCAAESEEAGRIDPLSRALTAPRTGRMGDIVATLRAEQDRIVRAPGSAALVIQGAPGTGKTAVALHRAAYLLYNEPQRRRGGVLVVGPNETFLGYISRVLPALGETDVVLATPATLYPNLRIDPAQPAESPEIAALKGDLRMAQVLQRAVSSRQRRLARDLPLDVGGTTVWLRREVVNSARAAARATGEPHNQARATFTAAVLEDLARQLAEVTDVESDAWAELHASRDVRREVNLCWMPMTPEQILSDLYARVDLRQLAAPHLSDQERDLLHRDRGRGWTDADAPLLDDLAELLGPPPPRFGTPAVAVNAEREEAIRFAEDTLASFNATGMLSAEELARRYGVDDHLFDSRPLAERAAEDPAWAFGHVVVDEAQDLTPMQWRMVLRRCPSRSLTIVGDLHQRTGIGAGATDWASILRPHLRHWREEHLTVNYRGPGEHLELATDQLRALGVEPGTVSSVRWGGAIDVVHAGGDLERRLRDLVTKELADTEGTVCLITVGDVGVHGLNTASADRFTWTTAAGAKGLEFDTVIVVEPGAILESQGPGALYVSLTRATQRLVLVVPCLFGFHASTANPAVNVAAFPCRPESHWPPANSGARRGKPEVTAMRIGSGAETDVCARSSHD